MIEMAVSSQLVSIERILRDFRDKFSGIIYVEFTTYFGKNQTTSWQNGSRNYRLGCLNVKSFYKHFRYQTVQHNNQLPTGIERRVLVNTPLSSLQVFGPQYRVQLVFSITAEVPTAPVPPSKKIEESAPASFLGDVSGHEEFGFMRKFQDVEIGRELKGMIECIPDCPENLVMDEDAYFISVIDPAAELIFFPLDNTPEVISDDEETKGEWVRQKTSLAEAFANMRSICADERKKPVPARECKKFIPLDLHTFGAWIEHDSSCRFIKLLADLQARYARKDKRPFKVAVLFADPVKLGECEEEHCVILDIPSDFSRGDLRVVDCHRRLYSLHEYETVIGIFIRRKDAVVSSQAEALWLKRGMGYRFKPKHQEPTGRPAVPPPVIEDVKRPDPPTQGVLPALQELFDEARKAKGKHGS